MLSHYHSAIDPEVENDTHAFMLRMVGFNKRVLEAGSLSVSSPTSRSSARRSRRYPSPRCEPEVPGSKRGRPTEVEFCRP